MEDNNIVSLVDSSEEKEEASYIKVYFTDTTNEIIPCDYFGGMDGLDNFIAVFTSSADEMPTSFFNTRLVKSIKVLKESDTFLATGGIRMETKL